MFEQEDIVAIWSLRNQPLVAVRFRNGWVYYSDQVRIITAAVEVVQ